MNAIRDFNPRKTSKVRRRGAILPLFALMLVGLIGFLALAIDIGIVAVAETQCQNAADNAALAGTRALNGTASGNAAAAVGIAQSAAGINPILSQAVTSGQVAVQLGAYHYDYGSMTFTPQFPPVAPDNYNLTQVTVTSGISSFFSRIFGFTSLNVQATATAAYRPRDVAIALDFSGSMNNEADLWNCETYLGNMMNTPNNTDPVFPQWGVYSTGYSPTATLQCTSTDSRVGLCNITIPISGIPALVGDLYANSRGAAAVSAFAASSATSTSPIGDNYLNENLNTSTTPARSISELTGSTSLSNSVNVSFVSQGYKYFTGNAFNGYTSGPNYWGSTFFIWPPDPTNDWRKNFFFLPDGVTPVNDDTALWDNNGNWLQPPGNYVINYKAILNWITNVAPNPFPPQLRSGNILYYSSIPTDVPASSYDHTVANSTIANQDQRFWKEYIDFALGVWRDPNGNVNTPGTSSCSYGPDFACGDGTAVRISGPDSSTKYGGVAFVAPTDNPLRPRHRFWFGPMTLIQYLLDTSISPGTFHDVSMVPAKLGINGAITDIQQNHPNDMVSMIYYARPTYANDPSGVGTFDNPISSLGRNYTSIANSLWYPPNSGSADVRPWDTSGNLTPRAHGDYDANTAVSYGLMLAYNQFSSNPALQGSGMGGLGRKGAQRLVILETDGMANVSTNAGVTNAGPYLGGFNVGLSNTYSWSGTDPNVDAINVANQICALYNDSSYGLPGFSTTGKPVSIQCIAFGALYEPATPPSENAAGIALLQAISAIGNSTFPGSASDPTNGYKWCIGTLAQRQMLLQQAFTKVLEGSVPISLVK
ncbi:MAG TPA: pilus assembly protein TadG-related protein [Pirellulales bacterium]|nr:pilus assembly protein TadG-related protein [Pirellulales bacterium]